MGRDLSGTFPVSYPRTIIGCSNLLASAKETFIGGMRRLALWCDAGFSTSNLLTNGKRRLYFGVSVMRRTLTPPAEAVEDRRETSIGIWLTLSDENHFYAELNMRHGMFFLLHANYYQSRNA